MKYELFLQYLGNLFPELQTNTRPLFYYNILQKKIM